MVSQVFFCDRAQAEKLKPFNKEGAIISIYGGYGASEPANLQSGWYDILRLEFTDNDVAQDKSIMFNETMANQVIDFVEKVSDHVDVITVHCFAGISRSAAVAKFISEMKELPFNKDYMLYNKFVYRTLSVAYAKRLGYL